MKPLHRADLYGWSRFDEARNMDFNSVLWVRQEGNVVVDPLPLGEHDQKHLESLGGVAHLVITNSDHVRDAAALAQLTGARVYGPAAEQGAFPLGCDVWLVDGAEVVPGLRALSLDGSKTPGELALLLDRTTLVTGDLVRAPRGGALELLPDAKLSDRAAALGSLERLLSLHRLEAVLPGDGWPVFRGGYQALTDLGRRLGLPS